MKFLLKPLIFLWTMSAIEFPMALADNANATVKKIWNESVRLEFVNKMAAHSSHLPSSNRLCATTDSQGGVSKPNIRTIQELLGPSLKSIEILQVANFETQLRFQLASDAISDALQKSPKIIFRYEPWSNSMNADYVGRLIYSDGKTGEISSTDGYICFQDHAGTHWWARYASPEDLNLKKIAGTLKFDPSVGYFIEDKKEHRLWLQMTENKLLVREVDSLANQAVTVTGELRRVPSNVTTRMPAGGDYFVYGFTIALTVK